ncbi:breast cancer metastasis-suppressor 1-like protein [Manduca sexta]|uniref:breast cancer metastasis-suppressor 1-like protein n=1 Tax=Manduca sexta TaxID=7130 RepID=UPI00188EA82F|nr:breast cancer metastasis-suppressor 1-like protein [Manduca sexta]
MYQGFTTLRQIAARAVSVRQPNTPVQTSLDADKWESLESEKWLAFENLKEEILEKIRKLEEERHTVDLWSCGSEWGRRRRKRQVTVSPPYVVYMLPDADIMEDWRLVRKLLERNE